MGIESLKTRRGIMGYPRVCACVCLKVKAISHGKLHFRLFLFIFFLYCFFSFYVIRERDELMDHVTSLKSQLKEMVQREEDAYQQMKKGIQLVEQAQLEQTEVCDWFLLFHSHDGLDVIL